MKKAILIFFSVFLFSNCQKEEIINQIIIPNYQQEGKYVFQPLPEAFGNVVITIWPSYYGQKSRIIVENRLDQPIAYLISDLNDLSFIYFSDNYIKAKGESETSASKIPLDETLYIKMLVYKSTLNYALVVLIEGLGLDFWQSISEYKDNLQFQYEAQLILES
jgi:hypothetical protein